MERLHQTLMGTTMSGRTWKQVRRGLLGKPVKISRRKSFLFLAVWEAVKNRLDTRAPTLNQRPIP